jgi:Holliday junction resolvase
MPSRQKAKGNNFERDVAKHLSSVFDTNFARVPTSGAMTGGMNADVLAKLTKSQKLLLEGDLIPPDHLYKMKIECKSHKNFSFSKIFSGNKLLDDWIKQAESLEKVWFLIFKINNRGKFIVFGKGVYKTCNCLEGENYLIYKGRYYMTPMEGFFEKYKTLLLKLCEG